MGVGSRQMFDIFKWPHTATKQATRIVSQLFDFRVKKKLFGFNVIFGIHCHHSVPPYVHTVHGMYRSIESTRRKIGKQIDIIIAFDVFCGMPGIFDGKCTR